MCLFYSLCLQKYLFSEEITTQTLCYLEFCLYSIISALRSLKKLGKTVTMFKEPSQEGSQWKLSGAHSLTRVLDSKGDVFEFLSAEASVMRRNAFWVKNLSSVAWCMYWLMSCGFVSDLRLLSQWFSCHQRAQHPAGSAPPLGLISKADQYRYVHVRQALWRNCPLGRSATESYCYWALIHCFSPLKNFSTATIVALKSAKCSSELRFAYLLQLTAGKLKLSVLSVTGLTL